MQHNIDDNVVEFKSLRLGNRILPHPSVHFYMPNEMESRSSRIQIDLGKRRRTLLVAWVTLEEQIAM